MAEENTNWVLIDQNDPLYDGDKVRLYFTVIGPSYVTAAQIALVEKKLESEKRFTVLSHSLPKQEGWLDEIYFEVRVNTPGVTGEWLAQGIVVTGTITGAVIAASIAAAFILAGIFCWLTFREIRKFVVQAGPETKELIQETGWTALRMAGAALLIFAGIHWLRAKR